ncbi:helix-turn-helix transcriptional regulator [Streptomyces albofaciens]|uniref:helix-turn-helix transcriptional regulator n=1 Tax=Streptomyces albofaciens TaxID=66866 RepID=UPI00142EF842|nr:helix-turn-helix transcriptional regulator [Streptomyces albofaciens]
MSEDQGTTSPVALLTRGQCSYVNHFALGESVEEIAQGRDVSRATVLEMRRKIMKRLGLTSLDQFEAFAQRYGDEAWERTYQ